MKMHDFHSSYSVKLVVNKTDVCHIQLLQNVMIDYAKCGVELTLSTAIKKNVECC